MKFITNTASKKVRHLAASLKSLINQLLIYSERNNVIRKNGLTVSELKSHSLKNCLEENPFSQIKIIINLRLQACCFSFKDEALSLLQKKKKKKKKGVSVG